MDSSRDQMLAALSNAKHEAICMDLDLADALAAKSIGGRKFHMEAAIRRHAAIARELRTALTIVSHRTCVLSMSYPANLGGGQGPDRI